MKVIVVGGGAAGMMAAIAAAEQGHKVEILEQNEKLGKAKRDAHFKGAFNNWDCNSHWYNGFNRLKNYNIKSKTCNR